MMLSTSHPSTKKGPVRFSNRIQHLLPRCPDASPGLPGGMGTRRKHSLYLSTACQQWQHWHVAAVERLAYYMDTNSLTQEEDDNGWKWYIECSIMTILMRIEGPYVDDSAKKHFARQETYSSDCPFLIQSALMTNLQAFAFYSKWI